MRVSMKEVAALANVSTATVSHVINNTRKVNRDTYEKVVKAINDLQYNVNPIARNLRNGRSKIIGFVVSNLSNYFYIEISRKIEELLWKEGYRLFHVNSDEDPDKEMENVKGLMLQNVDGLIVAPVLHDWKQLDKLLGDQFPCVFIDRKPIGCIRDCVLSTNFEGSYQSTELLIKKGHKKIGFLASHLDSTIKERVDGYEAALRNYGLPVHKELELFGHERPRVFNQLKSGESYALMKKLAEEFQITALFIGNNLYAIGSISFLQENNYSIPEDIDIVTFDDSFWLSMIQHPIPAMGQDVEQIGATAANILLKRINGNKDPYEEFRIPTKLI